MEGTELTIHCNVHFAIQAMTKPPYRRIVNIHDAGNMRSGVFKLLVDIRVNGIHHAMPHVLSRFPDDSKYCGSNSQTNNRVEQWKTHPDSDGSCQHCQRCEPVGAGMIAVRHQCRGANLFSHADAKDRHEFISQKTNDTCNCDPSDVCHRLRMDDLQNGLINGFARAESDHQHDNHTGNILRASITIGISTVARAAGEPESQPKWDGSQRI